ncbi:MAG TPA: MarR family transcriptional regulator [Steroidobacteraceae bacterium]|nr:MarR family transcriptional regulator [Steroidobacteraceae bacterium]
MNRDRTMYSPRRRIPANRAFERHVAGVDYGELDRSAGYAIRRAQIVMYEDFERELGPLRITPPRYSSLTLIARNPGLSQSELAELVGVGRSAMVAMIHLFEAEGWVRREGSPEDSRANSLRVTAKGQEVLDEAVRRHMALEKEWTAALTSAELRTLIALLDKVGGTIEDAAEPPRRRRKGNARA